MDTTWVQIKRRNAIQTAIAALTGALVTVAAGVLAAILAVVFAATMAVVMVLATGLLALSAAAWKLRRRPAMRGAVIEARKVGHSWVAYGWDQAPR